MKEKIVKFKIQRFYPETNISYVSTYDVPVKVGTTVLDALAYIKDHLDATLTFRQQCRMGQCGSCGVMINGKPMLACYTQVLHLEGDSVEVSPLSNLQIIRDLVVDVDPFFNNFSKIKPMLVKSDEEFKKTVEFLQQPKEFWNYWNYSICIKCSLCHSACPAAIDVDFLGPSTLTTNYRFLVDTRDEGTEKRLEDASKSIWLCTACNSCTLSCPKEIDCATALDDERSLIVEDGMFLTKRTKDILNSSFKHHNPLNMSWVKRDEWSKTLQVRQLKETSEANVLYYVGCLSSYDPRNQEVAKAFVKLMNKVDEDFAILGNDEWCCGDHILRLGEKGMFEELARHNISLFEKHRFNKIVTTSPHCYYVFKNEKPYAESSINVQHHTQYFAEMIEKRRLTPSKRVEQKVTYHDPCFLGKRGNIYNEPRRILKSIPGFEYVEMERNLENAFCCGGGAGRVWTEEALPEKRPSINRVKEALKLGVNIIATACPFCLSTLEDAVKVLDVEDEVKIRDISELLMETV